MVQTRERTHFLWGSHAQMKNVSLFVCKWQFKIELTVNAALSSMVDSKLLAILRHFRLHNPIMIINRKEK